MRFLTLCVLFAWPSLASAQYCAVPVQSYVAPLTVYQPAFQVYYELGPAQQAEALRQYQQRTDPQYDRWLQFKAFEAGLQYGQQQTGQPGQPSQQQRASSLLAKNCASCHGKELAAPKGGVFIDAGVPLSGDMGIEILRRLQLPDDDPDKMPPPPTKLEPQDLAGIMQEVLSLHKRQETVQ